MLPDLARQLLDALDEPALIVVDERIAAANDAARALLGERAEGQDVRLALRQPQAVELILGEIGGEAEIVGLAGAEHPWLLRAKPIAPGMMLARLTDLAAARSAERMRVDFVANASHELRTPLATIIGYGETLAEDGDLNAALRMRFASTIRVEAARMLRLIEELMSLSRIEADRFRVPDERVDLATIVRASAAECAELASQRGATVEMSIPADLPAVRGDSAQLGQLVANLLNNALRYGCGEGHERIFVTLEQAAGALRLAVRDQGDGIAAEHLPRLTERFYRVDAARSRDGGGTGLGLAIVKHIVERHRGTLHIDSTPGSGTEVTVTLPLA